MERRLTDAQLTALMWLTPKAECSGASREVSAKLKSLRLYHRDLVDVAWSTTPRGRRYLSYRLTDLGAEIRARLT